jgi:hypothetical protein
MYIPPHALLLIGSPLSLYPQEKCKKLRNRIFLHLKTSLFVHFMIQILSHGFNNLYTVTSFKILNDVAVCT